MPEFQYPRQRVLNGRRVCLYWGELPNPLVRFGGRASVLASPDFLSISGQFGLARTLALPAKGFGQHALLYVPWTGIPDALGAKVCYDYS